MPQCSGNCGRGGSETERHQGYGRHQRKQVLIGIKTSKCELEYTDCGCIQGQPGSVPEGS